MTDYLALWWVWLSAALVLGVIEILAPSFLALGFAIGAALMAAVVGFSLFNLSVSAKLAVFAVLSLAAWIALRQAFRPPAGSVKTFDHDIND